MKRILCLILTLCMSLTLFAACGGQQGTPQSTNNTTTDTTPTTEPYVELTGKAALDGKKIIFVGNSYTFWGNAVIKKDRDVLLQKDRLNDHGYFYQLCKANGIDVAVTNWTFGAHNITDMFGGRCEVDKECYDQNHSMYLTDAYYDYVAIQLFHERDRYSGDLVAHIQPTLDFFREANPKVKFLFLVPHMAHERNYGWLKDLKSVLEEDIIICDWGGLQYDLVEGTAKVPNGTQEYLRSTFVVSRSEEDGHHENLLSGYLTSLMVYCAITGESAVGQPYAFCDDSSLDPSFDLEAFRKSNYVLDPETNFVEVFRSEADMKGLQELADQYLAKYSK